MVVCTTCANYPPTDLRCYHDDRLLRIRDHRGYPPRDVRSGCSVIALNDMLLAAIEDDDHNPLTPEAVDLALSTCNLDEVLHDSEISNLHDRDHIGGGVSSPPSLVVDRYQLAS